MRRSLVAFAVVASLLLVTAQPAAAADADLEVASKNTTDSDFNNATTLTNVTVSGGTVALESDPPTVDDVEDGDVGEYSTPGGNIDTETTTVYAGSFSGKVWGISSHHSTSGLPNYPSQGDTYEVRVRWNTTGNIHRMWFASQSESDNADGYAVVFDDTDNQLNIAERVGGSYSVLKSKSFDSGAYVNEWMRVVIDWQTDGTIDVTVYDSTGTQVATIATTDSSFSSGGIGWGLYSSSGTSAIFWDNAKLGGGGVKDSGRYVSANHSADRVGKGFANLTLKNASATVEFEYWTGSQWKVDNSSTYTSGGNKTLQLSASASKWRTDVSFTNESGSPTTAELHDEGLLFNAATPSGSNPDPTGNITSYDGDVSLDVTDADFGLAQGDSVTVTAEDSGGTQIGSTSISSNQTVTFSYSAKAGQNDITWTLTDSYGETTTVSQTFTTPNVLSIYNESAPNQLVTGVSNEVTVSFFGSGDTVYRKSTTDGTVNLSGLPAAPPDGYQISIEDGTEYYSRSLVITSLFEQQSVYLLPTNASSVEVRFEINDQTGEYSKQSRLYISKPINKSGTVKYRTLATERFGVNGVTTHLATDTRYRLRIVSEDGKQTILGGFTPSVAETVALTPQPTTIDIENQSVGVGYSANISGGSLYVQYRDPTNTSDITMFIHERGNLSNQLRPNQSFTDVGTVTLDVPLSNTEQNTSWVVDIDGERRNGQSIDVRLYTNERPVGVGPAALGFKWRFAAAGFLLILNAAVWSELSVGTGVIMTGIAGGVLWYFGWLAGIAGGANVALAIGIGVLIKLARGGGVR